MATSISACTVPASSSAETASAAQRDQIGRIAPSSRSSARRSRKTASITRPPSQTAMLPRWTASTTTETAGAGEAAGCPASGQVSSAAPPSTARMIASARPTGPAQQRPEQERRRREQAQPDQVGRAEGAAQHVAEPLAGDVEEPATGRVRHLQPQVGEGGDGQQTEAGPGQPGRPAPGQPAWPERGEHQRRADQQQQARVAEVLGHLHRGLHHRVGRVSEPASTGGVDGAPTE